MIHVDVWWCLKQSFVDLEQYPYDTFATADLAIFQYDFRNNSGPRPLAQPSSKDFLVWLDAAHSIVLFRSHFSLAVLLVNQTILFCLGPKIFSVQSTAVANWF